MSKDFVNMDGVAFTEDFHSEHLENVATPTDQNICTWLQLRPAALHYVSVAALTDEGSNVWRVNTKKKISGY